MAFQVSDDKEHWWDIQMVEEFFFTRKQKV